jgi:competence protein ComEC
MKKRLLSLIIVLVLSLLASGCGRTAPKTAVPEDPAPQPQVTTPANNGDTPLVSVGPPVQEIYDPNQPQQSIQVVYVNSDAGLYYHSIGCKSLTPGNVALGLDEAKEEGYTPCPVCKPPK